MPSPVPKFIILTIRPVKTACVLSDVVMCLFAHRHFYDLQFTFINFLITVFSNMSNPITVVTSLSLHFTISGKVTNLVTFVASCCRGDRNRNMNATN